MQHGQGLSENLKLLFHNSNLICRVLAPTCSTSLQKHDSARHRRPTCQVCGCPHRSQAWTLVLSKSLEPVLTVKTLAFQGTIRSVPLLPIQPPRTCQSHTWMPHVVQVPSLVQRTSAQHILALQLRRSGLTLCVVQIDRGSRSLNSRRAVFAAERCLRLATERSITPFALPPPIAVFAAGTSVEAADAAGTADAAYVARSPLAYGLVAGLMAHLADALAPALALPFAFVTVLAQSTLHQAEQREARFHGARICTHFRLRSALRGKIGTSLS